MTIEDDFYEYATSRYEEVKHSVKGTEEHQEKLFLINLISKYEKKISNLPEISNDEFLKIRKEEFGY